MSAVTFDPRARIFDRAAVAARAADWRREGQAVVFTNGVFDLLHRGHVDSLVAARALGDRLVVGLNDDASVRRLKGPSRPVVALADRLVVVAALGMVDAVVAFPEDTPLELIRAVRPDVLAKGADYAPEDVVGADFVRAYGGRVETIALTPGCSTSGLVTKIRASEG